MSLFFFLPKKHRVVLLVLIGLFLFFSREVFLLVFFFTKFYFLTIFLGKFCFFVGKGFNKLYFLFLFIFLFFLFDLFFVVF